MADKIKEATEITGVEVEMVVKVGETTDMETGENTIYEMGDQAEHTPCAGTTMRCLRAQGGQHRTRR